MRLRQNARVDQHESGASFTPDLVFKALAAGIPVLEVSQGRVWGEHERIRRPGQAPCGWNKKRAGRRRSQVAGVGQAPAHEGTAERVVRSGSGAMFA